MGSLSSTIERGTWVRVLLLIVREGITFYLSCLPHEYYGPFGLRERERERERK